MSFVTWLDWAQFRPACARSHRIPRARRECCTLQAPSCKQWNNDVTLRRWRGAGGAWWASEPSAILQVESIIHRSSGFFPPLFVLLQRRCSTVLDLLGGGGETKKRRAQTAARLLSGRRSGVWSTRSAQDWDLSVGVLCWRAAAWGLSLFF